MDVYCKGTARIKHAETGEIYDVDSSELDWDAVGGDERGMGPETHYESVVEHPQLGRLSWGLWEYPVGVENYHETKVGPHELIEDFRYGLEHSESEPSEWNDYSIPDDPFAIFMNSYRHTGDLLADHGDHGGHQLVNRMIFVQQIAAMEAYLADKLINEVYADPDAFQRVLHGDDDLSKAKFTLPEIAKDPDFVKQKVREHLRSLLYHNLSKVNVLFNIALGIRILDFTENKEPLFKAVALRHDCVHRNGVDKDGKEIKVFTKKFVQETADLIKAFIQFIEGESRKRAGNKLGPILRRKGAAGC